MGEVVEISQILLQLSNIRLAFHRNKINKLSATKQSNKKSYSVLKKIYFVSEAPKILNITIIFIYLCI